MMIKFLLAYSFQKLFLIGQNLNRAHVTCSFDELLIFFGLTLADILFDFSLQKINTVNIRNLKVK